MPRDLDAARVHDLLGIIGDSVQRQIAAYLQTHRQKKSESEEESP